MSEDVGLVQFLSEVSSLVRPASRSDIGLRRNSKLTRTGTSGSKHGFLTERHCATLGLAICLLHARAGRSASIV
jgi:hypothetical protein